MPSTMVGVCANCHNPYDPADLYCLQCGCILPHAVTHMVSHEAANTNLLGDQQQRSVDLRWGTGYFHHQAKLFLRLMDTDHVLQVPLPSSAAVIGRSVLGHKVEVDLTPFDAADLGVSRHHARIDRLHDALQVTDLGSSNGTWLNRNKLEGGVSRILRNRAVLQLGKMVLRVQFA